MHEDDMMKHTCMEIISGFMSAIIVSILAISCSNLIYNNALINFFPIGIVFSLTASILMNITIWMTSRESYMVLGIQDAVAIIVALSIGKILHNNPSLDQDTLYITVLTLIVTMSLSLGLSFLVIAKFRLGRIIKYVPFPVISGFLAGTGVLIFLGGLEVATNINVLEGNYTELFTINSLIDWIPLTIYSILMIYIINYSNNMSILPFLLLIAYAIFYIYLWVTGISMSVASESGWLLGPFENNSIYNLANLPNISNVHWDSIFELLPDYFILSIMGIVALLFNINSIELVTNKDIDIDQEIKAAGIGNLIAACVGSIGGYQLLSASTVNFKISGKTWVSNLTRIVTLTLLTVFGISTLGLMPKAIFVIFLLYLGMFFIYDWLVLTYFKVNKFEYFIIPTIAFFIVKNGLLFGVIIGFAISLALFIYQFSNIQTIKYQLNGEGCRSNVERGSFESSLLNKHRNTIQLITLQSYIFFGNGASLVRKINNDLESNNRDIKYLILDFNYVFGIDFSAVYAFLKVSKTCIQNSTLLILSNVPEKIQNEFDSAVKNNFNLQYQSALDNDHAIEICENDILKNCAGSEMPERKNDYRKLLKNLTSHEKYIEYFTKTQISKGNIIIEEGNQAKSLYILISGEVEVFSKGKNDIETRISQLNKGTIIGEIGLIMNEKRFASVRATKDCILLKMSAKDLKRMKEEQPRIALDFYQDVLKITVGRFLNTSEKMKQLTNSNDQQHET